MWGSSRAGLGARRFLKAGSRLGLSLTTGILISASPSALSAQTVDGVLLERATDRPIDLAYLMLLTLEGDSVAATLTDAEGRFSVTAEVPGEFLLHAAALGYETTTTGVFELTEGGRVSVEFRLLRRPVDIGGITVDAAASAARQPSLVRNGFVDRTQQGRGRFIAPHDIANTPYRTTSDLLTTTGRVEVLGAGMNARIRMLGTRGYCSPTVYLDGARVSVSNAGIFDAMVPVTVLAAAEVYRSPSEAPVQYGGGMAGGCGVIVLWTRAR